MRYRWVCFLVSIGLAVLPGSGLSTDVDGPDGSNDFYDLDDAPHGIPAYPDSTIGRFPSVLHVNNYDAWNLWLGGYPTNGPINGVLYGVDSDFSLPHCQETAFGMTFGQDECIQDSTDMCLRSLVVFNACEMASFRIAYFIKFACCYDDAFLNVLVDFSGDGDFDDVLFCEATQDSVREWVLKNVEVPWDFPYYVDEMEVPAFRVGPRAGPAWMRITLTAEQGVKDDFHIAGDGHLHGGETEDYPIVIGGPVPVQRTTWGLLKSRYQ